MRLLKSDGQVGYTLWYTHQQFRTFFWWCNTKRWLTVWKLLFQYKYELKTHCSLHDKPGHMRTNAMLRSLAWVQCHMTISIRQDMLYERKRNTESDFLSPRFVKWTRHVQSVNIDVLLNYHCLWHHYYSQLLYWQGANSYVSDWRIEMLAMIPAWVWYHIAPSVLLKYTNDYILRQLSWNYVQYWSWHTTTAFQ